MKDIHFQLIIVLKKYPKQGNTMIRINYLWGNVQRQPIWRTVVKLLGNLQELCERVKYMVEMAQEVTLAEGDWFDGITVNRHMKGLNESYKVFEKTAQEISRLQERLSAAYEDIGQGLSKYFEIK